VAYVGTTRQCCWRCTVGRRGPGRLPRLHGEVVGLLPAASYVTGQRSCLPHRLGGAEGGAAAAEFVDRLSESPHWLHPPRARPLHCAVNWAGLGTGGLGSDSERG
jgi:hypothetical protein